MAAESNIIKQGATTTLFIDKFRDENDSPGTFKNAATATATLFDVSDPKTPRAAIGAPITLIFVPASDGRYEGDLAHDFASGALVDGLQTEIDFVADESPVHWEDTLSFLFET